MIYLYSKFHCFIDNVEILPHVFYEINDLKQKPYIVYGFGNNLTYMVDFFGEQINFEKVILNKDIFIFLKSQKHFNSQFTIVKHNGKDVSICCSNELNININGENCVSEKFDFEMRYANYQSNGDFCFIFFEGMKNYIVIIEKSEIKYSGFYDEVKIENNNYIFLNKFNDVLNHGKVITVKEGKFESYLVYLDNEVLKMKNEFTFIVFLDCLLAGNLKYCNQLLCEDIKQKDINKIKNYFKEFDEYIPFGEYAFTFKKNTLSGVYEFKSLNNEIDNIIQHQ